jgi:hypothetical protein
MGRTDDRQIELRALLLDFIRLDENSSFKMSCSMELTLSHIIDHR